MLRNRRYLPAAHDAGYVQSRWGHCHAHSLYICTQCQPRAMLVPVQMKDRIQVLEAQMKELSAQRATSAHRGASEHSDGHVAQPAQQGTTTCSDVGGSKSPSS